MVKTLINNGKCLSSKSFYKNFTFVIDWAKKNDSEKYLVRKIFLERSFCKMMCLLMPCATSQRKQQKDLLAALQKVVVPIYCTSFLAVEEEKQQKITRVKATSKMYLLKTKTLLFSLLF